jgi:hypothetical protein
MARRSHQQVTPTGHTELQYGCRGGSALPNEGGQTCYPPNGGPPSDAAGPSGEPSARGLLDQLGDPLLTRRRQAREGEVDRPQLLFIEPSIGLLVADDWRRHPATAAVGRSLRIGVNIGALLAGAGAAILAIPAATTWDDWVKTAGDPPRQSFFIVSTAAAILAVIAVRPTRWR